MGTRFVVSMLVFVLVGCSNGAPERLRAQLSFTHRPPILLKVSDVQTVLAYQTPLTAPHVEHLMPSSPAQAAKSWAADRLRATGGRARAVFTIREASVRHRRLSTDDNLKSFFTNEQADLYTAKLVCILEIFDAQGRRIGQALARARRERSGDESLTLNQRDDLWFDMMSDLMTDFDDHMEEAILTHLTSVAGLGRATTN